MDSPAILDDFRNLLILLIPGVFFVACLGGYWLSGRALGPVDQITREAKLIGVQNLSQAWIEAADGAGGAGGEAGGCDGREICGE